MDRIDINKVKSDISDYICIIRLFLNWTATWYLKHQEEIHIALEILDFILL